MRKLPFWKRNDLPVAKEGFPFIGTFLLLLALGILFQWTIFSFVTVFSLFYLFIFFRNPHREIPTQEGLFVAPADGRIVAVQEVYEDRFLKEKAVKISIFMNIFNVHVNRTPCRGTLKEVIYNPGKFFNAAKDKASLENEQNALILETPKGYKILIIQIAGLIARRIVCWIKPGDQVERGDRFGVIRFGSRVDVFLPCKVDIHVRLGEKVKGGTTVLGVLHGSS